VVGPQGEDWPEATQRMTFVIVAHHTEILVEGSMARQTADLSDIFAELPVIHPSNGSLTFKSAPHVAGSTDLLFV
jgi:hypothetical protein